MNDKDEQIIPVFEDEVLAAEVRRRHGDCDKVATTSLKEMMVDGVSISSRYNKAHEFDTMRKILLALKPVERGQIATLWCDSKATNCYSATLRRWDKNAALVIGSSLGHAAVLVQGGHNGFDISDGSRLCDDTVYVDPDWNEW